jgi:hypothetical protein
MALLLLVLVFQAAPQHVAETAAAGAGAHVIA